MVTLEEIKERWSSMGFSSTNDIHTHIFYLHPNRDALVCEWSERTSTLRDSFSVEEKVATLEDLEDFLDAEAGRFRSNPRIGAIRQSPYMPDTDIQQYLRDLEQQFAAIPKNGTPDEDERLLVQALNWILAEYGEYLDSDDEDEDEDQ